MEMSSLYFVAYALIATVGGIVIAQAQYARKQSEGKPINYTALKIAFGFALLMWTGAALDTIYYTESHYAFTISGMVIGVALSAFFAVQINRVIRKIQTDEALIEELSSHDSLTGLWNRRVFHERLGEAVKSHKERGAPLTVLLMDIENLGKVNHTYGYKAGDKALKKIAKTIMTMVREDDVVCRHSGNYITVVLPHMADNQAADLANRIREAIGALEFSFVEGETVKMFVSIGVAGLSEVNNRDAILVDAAFDALRAAQKGGASGVYTHTPDTPKTRPV